MTDRLEEGTGDGAVDFARTRPCGECPWRVDVTPGQFPPGRFEALARQCLPGGVEAVMACHKSPQGQPVACAGFVMQEHERNWRVRLSVRQGRVDLQRYGSDTPLYECFEDMMAAHGADVPEGLW